MPARLALLLLVACGPKVPEAVPEAPPPAPPVDVVEETPAPPAVVRCGGVAGLRCPAGLQCVDEPDDSCVPGRGADCIGRCVEGDEVPARRQVLDDPEACKVARFSCEAGEVYYSDASGCGCERASGASR
jgi:hypothetical protein